jgi:hypothetical protein
MTAVMLVLRLVISPVKGSEATVIEAAAARVRKMSIRNPFTV